MALEHLYLAILIVVIGSIREFAIKAHYSVLISYRNSKDARE